MHHFNSWCKWNRTKFPIFFKITVTFRLSWFSRGLTKVNLRAYTDTHFFLKQLPSHSRRQSHGNCWWLYRTTNSSLHASGKGRRLTAAAIKSLGENRPIHLAQHQPSAPLHAAPGAFKDSCSEGLERLSRSCLWWKESLTADQDHGMLITKRSLLYITDEVYYHLCPQAPCHLAETCWHTCLHPRCSSARLQQLSHQAAPVLWQPWPDESYNSKVLPLCWGRKRASAHIKNNYHF